MRFEGKVAVITGAGRGIGRAIAVKFAREGARVVVASRSEKPGLETLALIEQEGGEAMFVPVDVSRESDVAEMVRAVLNRWGKINILVNNAGIGERTGFAKRTTISDTSVEDWDEVIGVNLRGVFLVCRSVIPEMIRQGGGPVVNIASVAGVRAGFGGVPYTASKHGLIGFSKQLSRLDGPNGIRVNVICPGGTDTELLDPQRGLPGDPLGKMASSTPAGRLGRPEEVAKVAAFLASDESVFMHGAVVMVDGGATI